MIDRQTEFEHPGHRVGLRRCNVLGVCNHMSDGDQVMKTETERLRNRFSVAEFCDGRWEGRVKRETEGLERMLADVGWLC